MKPKIHPRPAALALAAGVWLLLHASVCRAGLLPIEFDTTRPVILGINGSLTYNASTGDFRSILDAATYTSGGNVSHFSQGQITIDVMVSQQGAFQSAGPKSFLVTGTVNINGTDVSGDANNPLLFGTVTDFGAQAPGPPTRSFDGFWDIQGGKLTGGGGFPVGGQRGVFLLSAENVTSGTLGDFTQNFSSNSVKVLGGVEAVPEPATWVLGLVGAAGMGLVGLFRRRRGPTG
jgi:hypothetical protein